MKILFDLTPLFDHLSGLERFGMNISKEIIIAHPENEYVLVFKNEIHSEFLEICKEDNIKTIIISGKNKIIFRQFTLFSALRRIQADYYIFLSFVSPFLFSTDGIINTIHDMSSWDCPGSRKWYLVLYSKICIKKAIRESSLIVTVSKFSRKRLVSLLKIKEDNVYVCYNGLTNVFTSDNTNIDVVEKYNLPNKYILCLSTIEPRKNMSLLIKAFCNLKAKGLINSSLVIAGRKGWKIEEAIGDYSKRKDSIYFTGFIEDKDLPAVYKNACYFVFPSIYEGFGIPLIEAMSQGTLVISSDSTSLPEVAGEAAIYFENDNLVDLEQKIILAERMSIEEKERYIDEGYKQCKKYNWKKEAQQLYCRIIKCGEKLNDNN